MQKTDSKLWVRFVPLLLILVLAIAACSNGDDDTPNTQPTVTVTPPTFEASLPTGGGGTGGDDTGGSVDVAQAENPSATFTASANDADGDELEYSWEASDDSVTLSETSSETTVATFSEAGTFTVTATVDDGSGEANATASDSATATIGEAGDPTPTPEPPTGGDTEVPTQTAFGASDSATGTFTSDADSNIEDDTDDRIVDVSVTDSDAGTFYLQVQATDNEGISGVTIQLRNAPVEEDGTLTKGNVALSATDPVAGFTLGSIQDTSTCALDGSETSVTCTYEVSVAAGTPEIESFDTAGSTDDPFEGEFAYVFRATVSDEAGNTTDPGDRGYVDLSQ